MDIDNTRKEQNTHLAKMFVIVIVVCYPIKFCGSGLTLEMARITKVWLIFVSCVDRILTYANSVLNPLIYALKGTEFRSGFLFPRGITQESRSEGQKYMY